LVVGALALALLPSLFARLGLGAFFAVLALAMAALLPLAPGFATAETREDQPAARASGAGNGILFPAVAMAGVMGFYVGLGGCWAYAALIAGQAGLDAQAVANRLAMASLVGIAGAGCAAGLGGRVVRGRALLVGYGLLVFAVLLLLGQPSMARFTLAAGLFKFGWTFALPFILSAVAHRDRTGSMMAATNLVIGTGNALGCSPRAGSCRPPGREPCCSLRRPDRGVAGSGAAGGRRAPFPVCFGYALKGPGVFRSSKCRLPT
jgi:hypothetical protein